MVIGLGLGLGFGTPARCDRQEAGRPGGQGGTASPEPAAVQKRITPARACGRSAARRSEALLCAAALERARLGDRLVQLCLQRREQLDKRAGTPWRGTYSHSSFGRSRKVSSGSTVQARTSVHATCGDRKPTAGRSRFVILGRRSCTRMCAQTARSRSPLTVQTQRPRAARRQQRSGARQRTTPGHPPAAVQRHGRPRSCR